MLKLYYIKDLTGKLLDPKHCHDEDSETNLKDVERQRVVKGNGFSVNDTAVSPVSQEVDETAYAQVVPVFPVISCLKTSFNVGSHEFNKGGFCCMHVARHSQTGS